MESIGAAAAAAGALGDEEDRRRVADRMVDALSRIAYIPSVQLACGELRSCPPDIVYYDRAAIDSRVERAMRDLPELLTARKRREAAARLADIAQSPRYDAAHFAPTRVPLYPAYLVDARLAEARSALGPVPGPAPDRGPTPP